MTVDFDAMSVSQRRVLGKVAINFDHGHHPATLRSLERLGLIESYSEAVGGHPPVTVTRYRMPLAVHIAWCEWCSRNV